MKWGFLQAFALLACSLSAHASDVVVNIDTTAARETLAALGDPSLTHEQALIIANIPGNLGVIKKHREFGLDATTQSFADALYASAHGEPISDRVQHSYLFDRIQQKRPALLALLHTVQSDPSRFQDLIEKRIARYTPSDRPIHITGYIVAAGDGGGYAFDDPGFYVNIRLVDDLPFALETTTHEMYHAVQNLFSAGQPWSTPVTDKHSAPVCASLNHLLTDFYDEGSAMYVDDESLMAGSHSEFGLRKAEEMKQNLSHIQDAVTLLDMSIVGLRAKPPLPYDDVYSVGFYGQGTLYNLGYLMAKAIDEQSGPAMLAALLEQPRYEFVLRYTSLPKYGADTNHPRLGAHVIAAAHLLADGCK